MGLGLLSQAGAALGLGLLAYHKLIEIGYADLGIIIITISLEAQSFLK